MSMIQKMATLAATVAGLALAGAAGAADLTAAPDAVPEAVAAAPGLSPWQVRVRGLGVITENSGWVDNVNGSGLSFSDSVVPEVDFTYYFTDSIAAELILGTTYSNVYGEGSLAGMNRIGRTWLLPPTLTLQYHFNDFGAFKPYVGAGVNYTVFYNQEGDAANSLDVKNRFSAALQVGADYMLDDHWGVNFDVKHLFLEPSFDVNVGGTNLTGKANLNPWLIGTGITYRF